MAEFFKLTAILKTGKVIESTFGGYYAEVAAFQKFNGLKGGDAACVAILFSGPNENALSVHAEYVPPINAK